MAIEILKDKRCLVTGATRGLGLALSRALAGVGALLFLSARNNQSLADIAESLNAKYMAVDLAQAPEVEQLADHARRELGGIDVLINCAGVFPVNVISDSSLDEYEQCFAVNVRAPFQLCRSLATEMVQRKWGRLINIGSSSAYSGFKHTSVYCASKHAILGLSRALHDELKEHNVRTFCISPGSIKTDMGRQVIGQNFETFLEPDEVADFIIKLISHDGPMIAEEVRLNRMIIQ